jgi:ketosteroid isomerase-like protein
MAYRDRLVDTYFDSLDAEDYAPLESAFTEDVTYQIPSKTVTGRDALMTYFREERAPKNTTHEVRRRIHDDDASAVEGHVTGERPGDDDLDGRFVDIFVFDEDAEQISELVVYPLPW